MQLQIFLPDIPYPQRKVAPLGHILWVYFSSSLLEGKSDSCGGHSWGIGIQSPSGPGAEPHPHFFSGKRSGGKSSSWIVSTNNEN